MSIESIAKEVAKSGMSISKEKLIEIIKKSNQQSFTISQSPNTKNAVVIINT